MSESASLGRSASLTGLGSFAISVYPGVFAKLTVLFAAAGTFSLVFTVSLAACVAESASLGRSASLTGLGSFAISIYPGVFAKLAVLFATARTYSLVFTIGLAACVSESASLGRSASLTGLGCFTISISPCMSENASLGCVTYATCLGCIAVSAYP